MKFKFNRRKKNHKKERPSEIEKNRNIEDESLQIPSDDDGKIIFQFKNTIPHWLVDELNNRFRSNKDRGTRSGALPA